ncbi:MAG: protein-L-isoaspartate(D-aspartate) O-methyltransferase [bacterium]|nr:protein-L-isoaspartate(D-aspartate) O-methyltransferase [bacterium]
MKDYTDERLNMVDIQLAHRGIKDKRVLDAMSRVPRHLFVPSDNISSAYTDQPLSIGESQTISQPYMVALMSECLKLNGKEKILELGTGSGYQTAILAELGSSVYTIERISPLSIRAQRTLKHLGYENIKFKVGDGTLGWHENAPYDGIMVTAGAPKVSQVLIDQLSEGGRIVIPVGNSFSQELVVTSKINKKIKTQNICGCMFVPLIGKYGWNSEQKYY